MIELPRPPFDLAQPRIKVFGIGNAGCNALDRLVLDGAAGVDLVAVNTDSQVLAGSVAPNKLQIGQTITRGLGAGGDPDLGKTAAEEGIGEILGALADANIAVLVTGLGGGTGSGATPVIAEVAREHGAMMIVVVTVPFGFEGKRRMLQAETALESLRRTADVLICFENDKMGDAVAPNAPIQEAFAEADRTISHAVREIAAFAGRKGIVHMGFDELASAFHGPNQRSVFGHGEASGDNRAHEALEAALKNPLLGKTRLRDDVENVVVSVSGGPDLSLNEVTILMQEFQKQVSDRTRVFFGAAIEPEMKGKLGVSILGSFEVPPFSASMESAPMTRVQRTGQPRVVKQPYPVTDDTHSTSAEAGRRGNREREAQIEEPAPAEIDEPTLYETESVPVPVARVAPPTPMRPPLARPSIAPGASTKLPPRPPREIRAEQMQLEPINRGRFEKSEPTIIDGQDLDVPTFLRRNGKT